MKPIRFPIDYPGLYWTIAAIVSLYYGVRGIIIQRHGVRNEHIDSRNEQSHKKDPERRREWSPAEQWIVHRIQDFIFNSVCGLAGFAALYTARRVFDGIADFSSIGVGTAATLAFLVLVAITGITGTLPMLIAQGKVKGWK